MYKYITILGAAGQIAQKLTATLLTYTDMHLTLYGRQLSTRLHPEILEHERVTVIEGSFQNPAKLEQAVTNAEIVFVGAMESGSDMASIVDSLVAPLSVINALVVALCMRKQNEVAETLETLEDIWDEYQVYESDEINYIDDHMKMRYGKVDHVDREDPDKKE